MINRKKKEAAAQAAAEAAAARAAAESDAEAAEDAVEESVEQAVSDSDLPDMGTDAAAEQPSEQPAREQKPKAGGDGRVEQLEAELEELKDQRLRIMAEYDNFRKRTSREKSSLSADIKADCVAKLLPVLDNLERAMSHENADTETLRKGVEMVLNQARTIFDGMGVSSFGEAGDNFDPQLHHCVSTVEAGEEYEADQITMVIQKGYMLGDRVIRPAMVQVAN